MIYFFFFRWREFIAKQYSGLFKSSRVEKKGRFSDLSSPTKLSPKWRWHAMIHHFVKELNTTEEKVYEMNYISSLNWQAYFLESNKVQEAQLKKIR